MNSVNRGLLTLFSFLSIIAYAILLILLSGWQWPVRYLNRTLAIGDQRMIIMAILAIMLLLALIVFVLCLGGRKTKAVQAMVEENSLGEISVTVVAVENLVNRIVTQIQGVRDVKQNIFIQESGVDIKINVVVTPDIKVPETAVQIQNMVQQQIVEATGLNVIRVVVSIDDISAVAKPAKASNKVRVE